MEAQHTCSLVWGLGGGGCWPSNLSFTPHLYSQTFLSAALYLSIHLPVSLTRYLCLAIITPLFCLGDPPHHHPLPPTRSGTAGHILTSLCKFLLTHMKNAFKSRMWTSSVPAVGVSLLSSPDVSAHVEGEKKRQIKGGRSILCKAAAKL